MRFSFSFVRDETWGQQFQQALAVTKAAAVKAAGAQRVAGRAIRVARGLMVVHLDGFAHMGPAMVGPPPTT